MGKSKIEKLKEKLYKELDSYGRDSPKVLRISKKLDQYIVEEMKKRKNKVRK